MTQDISIPQISGYFPFETPRPEQDRAWQFSHTALGMGFASVALQLPTGIGKSPLAIAMSSSLKADQGQQDTADSGGPASGAYILTTQRILQEQYEKDFAKDGAASVWSKRAYKCCAHEGASCAVGSLYAKLYPEDPKSQRCKESCGYKRDMRSFVSSPIAVTNTAFFLNQVTYAPGRLSPRKLLIVDECHNLEDALVSFVQVEVSKRDAEKDLGLKWPGKSASISECVSWIKSAYSPALKKKLDSYKREAESLDRQGDRDAAIRARSSWVVLDGESCRASRFLEEFDGDNWVAEISDDKWIFQPVEVGSWGREKLFEYGERQLLMSATILDARLFCDSVGLDPNRTAYYAENSPFPEENRPIYYDPAGSMSMKSIDSTLPKLILKAKQALAKYKGEKGIIHCHTYRIQSALMEALGRDKRLLAHGRDDREEVYRKHLTSKEPTVILSPSMSEGIDLKDDLSRWQAVCKMPYPHLGNARVKKKFDKNPRWFNWVTARTLIQATGRSIRTPEDFADTLIWDADLESLIRRGGDLLPAWWLKALK